MDKGRLSSLKDFCVHFNSNVERGTKLPQVEFEWSLESVEEQHTVQLTAQQLVTARTQKPATVKLNHYFSADL